jgi:hypothetical protein
MNWLQFISSIVAALAWPITAVVALVVLRRPLGRLLQGPFSRLKAGPAGLELEWERQAQQVRQEIGEVTKEESSATEPEAPGSLLPLDAELRILADVSPSTVVLESYNRVERQLHVILSAGRVAVDHPVGAAALARLAEQKGLIGHDARDAIEGLSVLRNLTAHGQAEVDTPRALDFAAMSEAVLYSLQRSGHGAAFTDAGRLVLLDDNHSPLGEGQVCRFSWKPGPGRWTINILTTHRFDLQSVKGAPSYLALFSAGEPEEQMFTLPLAGRPVEGAFLVIGE